ncbi:MAG: 3-methyl-2-oxobutanoate hydroxymethyltransferase [Alicyclobacillus herbarius]|uniref:3-methyl-2-oxobutanoate hydroxymethyltransferase n=1 Tax=Alicyclobacillus herbarius TaxID=122960 RepID=UPI0003FFA89F|nr:3-methyl-2-oxobutanoate hydroxymethyltransferase [Alicyclobacillus herbarius]MCL6632639.1 3-methyl-2-oxobutanoate hydroxymethyltransferase [Alicyclobacillus herbarius]
MTKPVTIRTFLKMKQNGEKIAVVTAYDYPSARLLEEAGVHALLVGDSLGMVVQGNTTTLPVTLDDIIYHTKLVARGVTRPLIIADLPFMTYQASTEQALMSAGRLMREGGAQAVKLEGGAFLAETVERLVNAGVPVMGHIGLTPQSVHALGGFAVQGRTAAAAKRLVDDAIALEEAGAFAVVLEMVPDEVAEVVSARLTIPTIGIGAGPHCDGQVLVFHDMMGYTTGYIPKHNKRFADLASTIKNAAAAYVREVANGQFPGPEQTIHLKPEERAEWADKWQNK